MATELELLSLVEDIYAAALDPALWQAVVRRIVEAVGGASGQLVSPTEHVLTSLWAPVGFDKTVMEPYAEYYHALDVWTMAADANQLPPCKAVTGEELVDFDSFRGSEYFNDFLKPGNFERIVCCYIDKTAGRPKTSLSVYRPPGSEPFDDRAVQFLNAISPHVRRAVQLHWRIADLEHKQATDTAIFERVSIGIALLDERQRVTYLNPAAQAIMNANDGLSVVDGELIAALGAETARLSRLVGEAIKFTVSPRGPWTGTMSVSRRASRLPYRVAAIPVPGRGAFPVGRQRTAAIVFISGEQLDRRAGLDMVAKVYCLTPAEKRLLDAILDNAPLKRAARNLGISVNTAHTQLNSILHRTGTHRQVELVTLVMSMIGSAPSSRECH